jgi:hypothetical protein
MIDELVKCKQEIEDWRADEARQAEEAALEEEKKKGNTGLPGEFIPHHSVGFSLFTQEPFLLIFNRWKN